ncbi:MULTISPECIES: hypothetical protein [Photorhabdus]|uniref:hypothetical protein n=1 Tax=Photorhabdus TaxID=29487 RepID=UPI002F26D413
MRQIKQTIRTPAGNGCAYAQGVCDKTAETADLQDLLVAVLQGLSAYLKRKGLPAKSMVKNIYTGPTAPAFLTDNLLAIFNERFGMRPITTVE